ncbi:acyl carrier protein [Duganella sp. CT11-25]|jgi:acyl carrier protein|uniref:acyl carrier protein n=1 Tax=unclassified Duganella TaxID=2636909 RepID=UPI0039AEA890
MNLEPLSRELAALLEIDVQALQPEVLLDEFANWDSLTKISLLVAIRDLYGVTVDAEALARLQTVGDLQRLLEREPQDAAVAP